MDNSKDFISTGTNESQQNITDADKVTIPVIGEQVIGINENTSNFTDTDKVTIPIIEEQVTIDKKVIEKGIVRLSKNVKENTEEFQVPLMDEEIVVNRVDKNQYVDTAPPAIRYEGDVMIISVLKEVPVVEKRLMLVEELHVTKKQTQKTETVNVVVRKEEVEVTRVSTNNEGTNGSL